MSPRSAAWLAWSLFGLYVLTVGATLVLLAFGGGTGEGAFALLAFGFAAVGALVASQQPRNAVGWLLLAIAVDFGLCLLAQGYLTQPGRPGEAAVGWFVAWAWFGWFLLPVLVLPMAFPNGRLLTPRWRIAVWIGSAAIALLMVGYGFAPGSLNIGAPGKPDNPLGVGDPFATVLPAAIAVGDVLAAAAGVLAGTSLVLRMRRSRGRERQQLKLFAYVATLALAGWLLAVPDDILDHPSPMWAQVLSTVGYLSQMSLIFIGLPLAIGVAILRHRLYDIDVVINRTLVYAVLTVSLAVLYLGLVLLFERVLSPVASKSDLAVAGSTLAVAALFRPARRRIQSIVDRRFYRQRYDAAQTLDAFAGRLRDELDLETVAADLTRVTQDTLRPTQVSLWLREARS